MRNGFAVKLLEYYDETGKFHRFPWTNDDGPVYRSAESDTRNHRGKFIYNSIILDAVKL